MFCENYCKGLGYIEQKIAVNMITFGKIGNVKNYFIAILVFTLLCKLCQPRIRFCGKIDK